MSKFTFINEEVDLFSGEKTGGKVTFEFENTNLYDVLGEFDRFLRGCGFHFDGFVDIVSKDDEEYYSSCENEHSINLGSSGFQVSFDELDEENELFISEEAKIYANNLHS